MDSPILCVGQSDSCAGTGIQADIKTVQAFGGYAATVVTAVAVQNTQGIFAMHMIPSLIVRQQIEKVMEDLNPKVLKTGMLANVETIDMIGDLLDEHDGNHEMSVVIDPVMTSRGGHGLLDKEARDAFKRRLLIYVDVLTPNIQEAYELSGIEIKDVDDMCHAAETLRTLGAKIVILKGGALATDNVYNVLADEHGTEIYSYPKIDTRSTHGAGTTLSAGMAACMTKGMGVRDAYTKAREFVSVAMEAAIPMGSGFGPLDHTVSVPSDKERSSS